MVRFNIGHPRAEKWLKDWSSDQITGRLVEDQRQAIRDVMRDGMAAGKNPRTTALDIVGRYSKTAKKRIGGLIGLTNGQTRTVYGNPRTGRPGIYDGLTSGDPGELRRYLGLKLRDKRFDGAVTKALNDGTGVPAAKARRMQTRYSDRALKHRGDMIARTETLSALNASHAEGMEQLIESGAVKTANVRNTWDSAGDNLVRNSHRAMDGQTQTQGEPFTTPTGYRMMHPGDSSLGAPASEIIHCRCIVASALDFFAE